MLPLTVPFAPTPPGVFALIAALPSPSSGILRLGPLSIRAYGLLIALGVVAAVWLANRRWVARGGSPDDIGRIAVWAVPAGVVGARLYHVATDWPSFEGRWMRAFEVWRGGLGIWGGVALGVIVGLLVARSRRLPMPALLDTVAPALPLAQAIGRWGNWFNQELFGRPTDLPWGLRIDPQHRPRRFADVETFHPTFLYESVWNLLVVASVLTVERRFPGRLRPGRLFALYVALYSFGRFWIERIRVDPATTVAGLRVNEWVAGAVFLAAAAVVATGLRRPVPTTAVDVGGPNGSAGVEPGTSQGNAGQGNAGQGVANPDQ